MECIQHLIGFIRAHRQQNISSRELYNGCVDSLRTAIGEELQNQLTQLGVLVELTDSEKLSYKS